MNNVEIERKIDRNVGSLRWEIQPTPTENFWVEVHFGGHAVPRSGHLGSMLGPCWVIWWAMWGLGRSLEGKKTTNRKVVRWRFFLVTSWDYDGPMLGHLGSMLGPCWVIWWAYVGPRTVCSFWPWNKAKRNTPFWGHVGAMLGLCRTLGGHVGAMLGLCWAYVGPRTACSCKDSPFIPSRFTCLELVQGLG